MKYFAYFCIGFAVTPYPTATYVPWVHQFSANLVLAVLGVILLEKSHKKDKL